MIIYKLTSPSNKIYIGQTKQTLDVRWKQHVALWKQYKRQNKPYIGCSTKLFHAFDKYPLELWQQKILIVCNSHSELNRKEVELIAELNAIESGYNITKGGSGRNVDYLTAEHKAAISKSRKAYFQTEAGQDWKKELSIKYTGNNNPSANKRGKPGRPQSEEERKVKSDKLKALHASGYYKQFDYTKSEETKRKISETKKANPRKITPEEIAKRIATNKARGFKQTEYQKAAVRKAKEHQHLITYEDGHQDQFGSFKTYAEKTKIPFETLRTCFYRSVAVKKYSIQSIIKLP